MTTLVYGQNRTITEATTILTILMDRTDTIITIRALTTFRPTGITDIISTAAGTAGIVTNIGVRMTSKNPAVFARLRNLGLVVVERWNRDHFSVFKDQSSIEVGEDTLPMLPDGLGVN
jgi:hypothetical protein